MLRTVKGKKGENVNAITDSLIQKSSDTAPPTSSVTNAHYLQKFLHTTIHRT